MEADPGKEWIQVPKDSTVVIFETTAEAEVIKAADIAAMSNQE